MDSDEALLRAFHSGDEAAFQVLFERHSAPVTLYAWRMLQRREEAEEVCLDAFVRVVERRWRPTGSFRAFLFTVVHRRCLDRLRRRKLRQRLLRVPVPVELPQTPEQDVLAQERREALEQAIAGLTPRQRSTLLLFYYHGLSSREVAGALGCSDDQIRARLTSARRALRRMLETEAR